MKQIYLNLMIWTVALFGMSLTAQTVADKHKLMLPQSGKLQWEKPVKAMIKPKMPVVRTPHDRMNQPVASRSASYALQHKRCNWIVWSVVIRKAKNRANMFINTMLWVK